MKRRLFVGLLLIALLLLASLAAANHGGYHLEWWTSDGGGGLSSGDGYTLHGTAGQPDAGALTSNDGAYTLNGGFWGASPGAGGDLYLPIIRDN